MSHLTIFQDKQFQEEVAKVLPKFFTLDKMMRIALTEFRKNPKLAHCSLDSIRASLLTAAQLGLDVGGISGKLHFVPYKGECTPIISYKGMCELAWRTPRLITLDGDIVCRNDHFIARKGSSPFLEHEVARDNRGEIIGTYAYAHLINDGFKYTYLSLEEIKKVGEVQGQDGKMYPKSTFWQDYFEEMAKKTAIRRLFKTLPDNPDINLINHIDYSLEKGMSMTEAHASAKFLTHDSEVSHD